MNDNSLKQYRDLGERLKSLLNNTGWKDLEKYLSLYLRIFVKKGKKPWIQ